MHCFHFQLTFNLLFLEIEAWCVAEFHTIRSGVFQIGRRGGFTRARARGQWSCSLSDGGRQHPHHAGSALRTRKQAAGMQKSKSTRNFTLACQRAPTHQGRVANGKTLNRDPLWCVCVLLAIQIISFRSTYRNMAPGIPGPEDHRQPAPCPGTFI